MNDAELINKLEEVLTELKERKNDICKTPQELKEKIYHLGDCFLIYGNYYMLSAVEYPNKVCLVCLENGNRFNETFEVFDWNAIKESELEKEINSSRREIKFYYVEKKIAFQSML